MAPERETRKVFVGGLPAETTRQELERHFSDIGPIKKCFVVKDPESGQCKGFAYIQFALPDDATRAVKEGNRTFKGATLKIDFGRDPAAVRPKSARASTAGSDRPAAASAGAAAAPAARSTASVAEKPVRTGRAATVRLKQARLIVRNLPFDITEEQLHDVFRPHGRLVEVHVPRKDGRSRGFAFIGYTRHNQAAAAIAALNGSEIGGRRVAVDFSLAKDRYERSKHGAAADGGAHPSDHDTASDVASASASASGSESESASEPESAAGSDADRPSASESDSGFSDADSEVDDEGSDSDAGSSADGTERELPQTVFVRNLPADATPHDLRAAFAGFGRITGAYIVRDPATGHSRGSAFVHFADAAAAAAAVAAGAPAGGVGSARTGAGVSALDHMAGNIAVCGRRVVVTMALSRQEARQLDPRERRRAERSTDRRNLYLADEGYIAPGSDAAAGVSETDMAKREASHQSRLRKLENPNISVSQTRLCVRNLPRAVDEAELRKLVAGVVGGTKPIKQVKIVRDSERTVAGAPRSRGYGFVELRTHDDALKVLRRLNNNPAVWGVERRPIVEFALDDARKLQKHQQVERWGALSQKRALDKAARREGTAEVPAAASAAGRQPAAASKGRAGAARAPTASGAPVAGRKRTADAATAPAKRVRVDPDPVLSAAAAAAAAAAASAPGAGRKAARRAARQAREREEASRFDKLVSDYKQRIFG